MADLKKLILGDHDDPRQQLEALFGGHSESGTPSREALAWGRDVVARAGVDPSDQVASVKAMREAEPRLDLKPATYLAAHLDR